MAITSYGYGQSELNEAEWARLAPLMGGPYGYSTSGACAPYVASGLTLGFQNGSTGGYGVLDDFTSHTVDLPGTAGWWCVCLRRSWGGLGRKSEIVPLPAGTVGVPSSRKSQPGVQDDQPLAFVQTSTTGIIALVDARQNASKSFYVRDLRAVHDPQLGGSYHLPDGVVYDTVVSAAGTVSLRKRDAPAPTPTDPGGGTPTPVASLPIRWGVTPAYFDSQGLAVIRHNLEQVPSMVMVQNAVAATTAPVVLRPADPAHVPEALTAMTFKVYAKRADTGAVVPAVNRVQWVVYGRSA